MRHSGDRLKCDQSISEVLESVKIFLKIEEKKFYVLMDPLFAHACEILCHIDSCIIMGT